MWSRHRYRKLGSLALVPLWGAGAQMHHVEAPQRVTRAVGVYEWTGELPKPSAARFVPVSLFIDGHLEDAGLYLARPVPFALQTGNLYTVEHAGEPAGMLDVEQAERVVTGNALADDNPVGAWYGFGTFTAEAAAKPVAPLHRSAHVGTIQSTSDAGKAQPDTQESDGRPHMNRRSPATDSKDAGGADGGQDTSATGTGQKDTTNAGGDDTDRPTLARRDPAQDAARSKAALGGKKGGTASVTAVGPAPGDDPDRPTLSHNTAAQEGPKELTGMPADLHQAVAVSDPVLRDPHPFARGWDSSAERTDVLNALAAVAKSRVTSYLNENKLVASSAALGTAGPSLSTEGRAAATEDGAGAPPTLQRGRPKEYGAEPQGTSEQHGTGTTRRPATPASAQHRATKAAPGPVVLQEERIEAFTLSYGGLPTFVYSASVAASAAVQTVAMPAATAHPTAFVLLVAQRLPSGELQTALSAVTDSTHLDRSPRLRLIDAVDPDASHRASLLFELRGSSSRQFALYRLISTKAENTFTSASIE